MCVGYNGVIPQKYSESQNIFRTPPGTYKSFRRTHPPGLRCVLSNYSHSNYTPGCFNKDVQFRRDFDFDYDVYSVRLYVCFNCFKSRDICTRFQIS